MSSDVSPEEFKDLAAHVSACGARYHSLQTVIGEMKGDVKQIRMWLVMALGAAFLELLAITIAVFVHFAGGNH